MQFYWLQNKQQNQNFVIYCDSGDNNLTNYYKKHHAEQHHKDNKKHMFETN